MYSTLEQVPIKACTDEDYSAELQQVTELYDADFNKSELAIQLQLLSCMDIKIDKESIMFRDIHIHFQSLVDSQVLLLAQVARVVKFALLMPATNAISEQSASAMHRTETYLRSTMTQLRMNNVMVLHIHKHHTDDIEYCCGIK